MHKFREGERDDFRALTQYGEALVEHPEEEARG
jgi:hypothetical protein